MSFTRFNYDVARTHKKLQQSTDVGRYMLNVPGNLGDKPMYVEDPHLRLTKWGANVMENPVDIASDLDGRMRKAEKYCPKQQFPYTRVQNPQMVDGVETMKAYTDETRASHPAWMYRDLEQTRWEYPIYDPQENVCKHFYNNTSTRMLERDNFNKNPQHYYSTHT